VTKQDHREATEDQRRHAVVRENRQEECIHSVSPPCSTERWPVRLSSFLAAGGRLLWLDRVPKSAATVEAPLTVVAKHQLYLAVQSRVR
jgi:hypothetical protein